MWFSQCSVRYNALKSRLQKHTLEQWLITPLTQLQITQVSLLSSNYSFSTKFFGERCLRGGANQLRSSFILDSGRGENLQHGTTHRTAVRFWQHPSHSLSQKSKSMPWPVCWRSWRWTVLWRPSRSNTQKRFHFHYRGDWNVKVGS